MHPLGCFGSSLAYAPQTTVCQACDGRAECEALVEGRRPQVLRLLSRFTDAKGEPMAVHWLTPAEKKQLKANRKAAALAEAERATYGSEDAVTELKAGLDKRAHSIFDQLTAARINCQTRSLEFIGGFSKAMATVILLLRSRPRTMQELTAELGSRCGYSASNAQREAYSLVSILTVCDRAKRSGPFVELT